VFGAKRGVPGSSGGLSSVDEVGVGKRGIYEGENSGVRASASNRLGEKKTKTMRVRVHDIGTGKEELREDIWREHGRENTLQREGYTWTAEEVTPWFRRRHEGGGDGAIQKPIYWTGVTALF